MTKRETQKLKHGLYRIYWKSDSNTSLASVGSLHDGTRWFAPTNWTAKDVTGIVSTNWKIIKVVEQIA